MSWLRSAVPDEVAAEKPAVPLELPPLVALSTTKPRPYQVELLVWSLLDFRTDQGSLVCLPTGSGKTLVGALVNGAMAHANPKKRLAFVVDKVPLLEQQAEYFRRHTQLQVVAVSGATRRREELLRRPFDVLVVTAKCFANMLQRQQLSPAQFALVTLDEAHHCVGGHPFMEVIKQVKCCSSLCRPRVLGLSASPAGAATEERTRSLLWRLEESLHARPRAPTVHSDALLSVVKPPMHRWVHVCMTEGMQHFQADAGAVLREVAEAMAAKLQLESLKPDSLAAWQCVYSHVEQEHPALISDAKLAVQLAEAMEISKRLGDCYGMDFLRESLAKEARIDRLLQRSGGSAAPHLAEAASILQEEAWRRGAKFRALIFVETRAMARRLAAIMAEMLRQQELNPQWLVGHARSPEDADVDQQETLKRFRSGEVRLLVCTSVAEEGLDVPECSVVIRMHAVRAFSSFVQSRGRVRADQGVYVLVGSPEEQRSLADLQKAEGILRMVLDERMAESQAQVPEVQRATKQLLEDGERVQAAAAPAPNAGMQSSDVLCMVVHGLTLGHPDDVLRLFAYSGTVVGCECERGRTKFPDLLRPAGHSALVQLRPLRRPQQQGPEYLCKLLRKLPPGLWLREEAKVAKGRIEACRLTVMVEAGSFLNTSSFATQAVFPSATLHLGPKEKALRMSVPFPNADCLDIVEVQLEVHFAFMDFADAVLLDIADNGAWTFFAPVSQPPRFSVLVDDGGRKARRERHCMPPEIFGSSFVYAFRFDSSEVEQAKRLLSFMRVQAGLRCCCARIARTGHNMHVPVYPKEEADWDDILWDLEEEIPAQQFISPEAALAGQMLRLIRSMSGPAVLQEVSHRRVDFLALYSLLCALSRSPVEVCSALTPGLIQALQQPGAAALLTELPARLFPDTASLLQETAASPGARDEAPPIPEHNVLVRCVTVTPTRLIFHEAEQMLSNRILRQFGEPSQRTADRFLRVQFRDEDEAFLPGKVLQSRIHLIFEKGLRILGRHYQYLHWSQSQLRNAAMWLYASDGKYSCEFIRDWVFLDPSKAPRQPSKYASRLALFFSSSLPTLRVAKADVETLKDVERNDYCFTDGAGQIRPDLAAEVARLLGCKVTPSAFQIRYAGAKGVVVAYPDAGKKLQLRKSMVKFDSPHDSFEVVSWSRRNPATLNQQIILLLACRGVEESVFVDLQEQALLEASKIVVDPKCAQDRLGNVYTGSTDVSQLSCAGLDLISEPFHSSLLRFLYRRDVQLLRTKTQIPVEQGALLLGVPDETARLQYGEVFIQVSQRHPSGGVRHEVIKDCWVMVTKNPCLHPGDILRLRAVDCPELRHIVDCVVFPVQGHRPHPNETSGSDLDGDLYFCTWSPELVPAGEREPMNFPDAAALPLPEEPVSEKDMENCFIFSATGTSLGVIANAHRVHADSSGADSKACLQLAQLHSDAVDAPKTGQAVEVPSELVPKTYPAWMEKEDDNKDTSMQDTLLQRLHDMCPQVSAVTDEEVQLDSRFVLTGHEAFLERAKKLRDEYNEQLLQLMRRFKLKFEAEIFTKTFDRYIGSPKEKAQLERMVQESYAALARRYRQLFSSEERGCEARGGLSREAADWTQRKASAWYVAAYSEPNVRGKRLLSFAWLMADHLITICPASDGVQRGAVGQLFHSLAESIGEVWREAALATDGLWRSAERVAQCIGKACVEPAGLVGLGLLPPTGALELSLTADEDLVLEDVRAALQHSFPKVEEEGSVLKVVCEGKHLRLLVNSCRDKAARGYASGCLLRHPELAPVCFVLAKFLEGMCPAHAMDLCLLLLQHSDPEMAEGGSPEAWSSQWPPAALEKLMRSRPWEGEEPTALHPGKVLHSSLEWLLERARSEEPLAPQLPGLGEPSPRDMRLRVALLRAFQHMCLDGNVLSLVHGEANPDRHRAVFSIQGIRGDAPLQRLEEQLRALGRGEVQRVWLDAGRGWPAIKVEVRGSRSDLKAIHILVKDLGRRLRDNTNLRLLTSWRGQLLVDQHKQQVLAALQRSRVIIVSASTGSGKSTGIPRLMLEDDDPLAPKRIICTQPRRVGATSLSQRVAKLCNSEVGAEVGFRIGGAAEVTPGRTKLVYETTAIAMQQFLQGTHGPQGVACTHLIVDEVHNRTVFDDVLLAVVKHCTLKKDKQLKVILMSAATNSQRLAEYFTGEDGRPAEIVRIEGNPYNKAYHYLEDVRRMIGSEEFSSHYAPGRYGVSVEYMAQLVWWLHETRKPTSRFLIFLPGRGDIKKLSTALWDMQDDDLALDIKPLHAGISVEKQEQMLAAARSDCRMVILATDVVESSVTIPDVDVVVDCCSHKRRRWDDVSQEYELQLQDVTKDEALQRAGRTGRLADGEVFRLITQQHYSRLPEHAEPAMRTASVSELLLLLAGSPEVKDPRLFLRQQVMSPPDMARVDEAFDHLEELGAIERGSQSSQITPTLFGKLLQRLPVEPQLGLLVWNGLRFSALEDCEILAGIVQRGSPFALDGSLAPKDVRRAIETRAFCWSDSDLIAGLRAYQAWQRFLGTAPSVAEERLWCESNFLSLTVLQEIQEMRMQIHAVVAELGWADALPEEEVKKIGKRRVEHLQQQDAAKLVSMACLEHTMEKLIGRAERKERRFRLVQWCIALAFLPNTVEVNGAHSSIKYKCKRKWAPRLLSFLLYEFGLQGRTTSTSNREVAVAFSSPEEAQKAVQIGNVAVGMQFPYNQSPQTERRLNPRPFCCYTTADMILGSDSVCVPVVQPGACALVGTNVLLVQGERSNHFMMANLTAVPTPILGPLLALRANGKFGEGKASAILRGKREERPVAEDAWEDVEALRRIQCRDVQSVRRQSSTAADLVIRIMEDCERAAQQACSNRTVKELTAVPTSMHGKLIGKGGSNIKALKEAHPAVEIDVPKGGGHVRLEGARREVEAAEKAIMRNLGLAPDLPPEHLLLLRGLFR